MRRNFRIFFIVLGRLIFILRYRSKSHREAGAYCVVHQGVLIFDCKSQVIWKGDLRFFTCSSSAAPNCVFLLGCLCRVASSKINMQWQVASSRRGTYIFLANSKLKNPFDKYSHFDLSFRAQKILIVQQARICRKNMDFGTHHGRGIINLPQHPFYYFNLGRWRRVRDSDSGRWTLW